nr:hypothetical protein [Elizabethkingia sp. ASV34]
MNNEETKEQQLLCYNPPTLEIIYVDMENGISASSATVNPGDLSTPQEPGVEGWNDNGNTGNGDYDF